MATKYEESTWDWNGQVKNIYDATWYSQTFTPSVTHDISSVILALGRVGNPGTITVSIKNTTSGKPTGEDLCVGTTNGDTLPILGWPTPLPEEREITFSSTTTLTAETMYAIVVRAASGNSSNKLHWVAYTSSVYDNGTECYSVNSGGSWTLEATRELWFEEWGDIANAKATNPTPAHTSTGVDFSGLTLSWDGTANSYNIYFGNTVLFNEWVYLGNTADTSIVVPYTITGDNVTEEVQAFVGDPLDWINTQIDWNDDLSWRVDSVFDDETVTGDVWWFNATPAKTSVPSPTDALTDITLDWMDFSWTGAPTATSYDTYCAKTVPGITTLVNVVNSSAEVSISQEDFIEAAIDKVSPSYSGTYLWRVDSKNLFGVAEGDAWTFYTIAFDQPKVSYELITGGSGDGPYDGGEEGVDWYYTGENNMVTIKRLVAVAENKFWYEDV